jgi:hypothetical protein
VLDIGTHTSLRRALSGAALRLDNLPAPEVIAPEIVEDLQAALDQFIAIASSLSTADPVS